MPFEKFRFQNGAFGLKLGPYSFHNGQWYHDGVGWRLSWACVGPCCSARVFTTPAPHLAYIGFYGLHQCYNSQRMMHLHPSTQHVVSPGVPDPRCQTTAAAPCAPAAPRCPAPPSKFSTAGTAIHRKVMTFSSQTKFVTASSVAFLWILRSAHRKR